MMNEIDTERIRRNVYMTYFQDGLWDMVLGLFLLGWGLTVSFDLPWLPGATFITFFWLALGLKQKITYPRIGYVKAAEQRNRTIKIIIVGVVAFLLGVAVFLMVINRGMPGFLYDYFELLFGCMLATAIGLIAYWWRIVRWYIYSGLVLMSAVANQWLGLTFTASFIVPGIIILGCGIVILRGFLREYPVIKEETIHDDR